MLKGELTLLCTSQFRLRTDIAGIHALARAGGCLAMRVEALRSRRTSLPTDVEE